MLHKLNVSKAALKLIALGSVSALAVGLMSLPTAANAASVSTKLTKKAITLTIADETGFPLTDKLAEEFTSNIQM